MLGLSSESGFESIYLGGDTMQPWGASPAIAHMSLVLLHHWAGRLLTLLVVLLLDVAMLLGAED